MKNIEKLLKLIEKDGNKFFKLSNGLENLLSKLYSKHLTVSPDFNNVFTLSDLQILWVENDLLGQLDVVCGEMFNRYENQNLFIKSVHKGLEQNNWRLSGRVFTPYKNKGDKIVISDDLNLFFTIGLQKDDAILVDNYIEICVIQLKIGMSYSKTPAIQIFLNKELFIDESDLQSFFKDVKLLINEKYPNVKYEIDFQIYNWSDNKESQIVGKKSKNENERESCTGNGIVSKNKLNINQQKISNEQFAEMVRQSFMDYLDSCVRQNQMGNCLATLLNDEMGFYVELAVLESAVDVSQSKENEDSTSTANGIQLKASSTVRLNTDDIFIDFLNEVEESNLIDFVNVKYEPMFTQLNNSKLSDKSCTVFNLKLDIQPTNKNNIVSKYLLGLDMDENQLNLSSNHLFDDALKKELNKIVNKLTYHPVHERLCKNVFSSSNHVLNLNIKISWDYENIQQIMNNKSKVFKLKIDVDEIGFGTVVLDYFKKNRCSTLKDLLFKNTHFYKMLSDISGSNMYKTELHEVGIFYQNLRFTQISYLIGEYNSNLKRMDGLSFFSNCASLNCVASNGTGSGSASENINNSIKTLDVMEKNIVNRLKDVADIFNYMDTKLVLQYKGDDLKTTREIIIDSDFVLGFPMLCDLLKLIKIEQNTLLGTIQGVKQEVSIDVNLKLIENPYFDECDIQNNMSGIARNKLEMNLVIDIDNIQNETLKNGFSKCFELLSKL